VRLALLLLLSAGCRQLLGFEGLEPADVGSPAEDGRGDGPAVGCQVHGDCLSQACLPDGRCADESEVAYVASDGLGTTCVKAMPCGQVNDALGTKRAIVKISGTIAETLQIAIDNTTVSFLADPGARVTRLDNNLSGATFKIKEGSATIVGLEITNTITGQAGIDLEDGSLVLDRVRVTECQGRGLDVRRATELTISRSIFANNVLGGVVLQDARFAISNSLVVRNGSPTSAVGGVRANASEPGSTFELNTVADNVSNAANTSSSAVSCGEAFTAHSNIVRGFNDVAALGSGCTFEHSLFTAAAPPGLGNLQTSDLKFQNVDTPSSSGFFRITATSPAVDQGVSTIAFDIDGQPRPAGAAPDMGADEAQ
jgi:hypothetical protein